MTEAQAWQAQEYYRERYTTVGKYENRVYPGIRNMLRALRNGGVRMGIVTGKPENSTRDILAYFGLDKFFECYSCGLKDLSPLASCTELKHLNVCYNHLTDITPLFGLTQLERLWISRNDIPAAQIAQFKELMPNCEVNTTTHNPTRGGWRYYDEEFTKITPRYELLRQQFRYDRTELRSYGDGWWADSKVHTGDLPPVESKE